MVAENFEHKRVIRGANKPFLWPWIKCHRRRDFLANRSFEWHFESLCVCVRLCVCVVSTQQFDQSVFDPVFAISICDLLEV